MSREALLAARAKVRALIAATPNAFDDTVGNVMRSVQEDFAEWLAENPDAAHEVRQHFIRGVILHGHGKFDRREEDDGVPDYVLARRETGYHRGDWRECGD